MTMARLGDFQFSLDTAAFDDLSRQSAYRWAAKPRIGRAPALQFTGTEAEAIKLSGTIYPHFRGGLGQVDRMRAMAGGGEPLPLIYASTQVGQLLGLWCITSIDEGRTVFFSNGAPRKITFSLGLQAYGEDLGLPGGFQLGAAAAGAAKLDRQAGAVTPEVALAAERTQAGALAPTVAGITSAPAGAEAAAKIAAAASGTASGLEATARGLKDTTTGAVLNGFLSTTNDLLNVAGRVRRTVDALGRAGGDPLALVGALGRAGSSLASAAVALNGIANRAAAVGGRANGGSQSSAFGAGVESFARGAIQRAGLLSSIAAQAAEAARKIGGLSGV